MSASPNSNILLNGSLEGGTVTTATSGENAVSTNTLRCQDSTAAGCGGRRPGGGYYPESSTDQSRPNLRAALDRIPPSERNIVLYYGTPDQYDYMNKLSELKAGTIRPLPRACADMTTLVRPCWEPNMTDQQAALMMRPYRTSTLTSQVRPDGQVTYNSGEATTTIPIWPPQVPRRRADQVGCPEMPEGRESGESLSDLIDAAMPPDEAANCKTQARGRVTNSLDAMDAAAATSLLGLINLGGAAGSTEQDSDISSESMSSGCTDVITTFANTLIAENSIMCEVSDTRNSIIQTQSTNASILVDQLAHPRYVLLAVQQGAPRPPSEAFMIAMASLGKPGLEIFRESQDSYDMARELYSQEIRDLNIATNIKGSTFTAEAGAAMKLINNLHVTSKLNIVDKMTAIAHAEAENTINEELGFNSPATTNARQVAASTVDSMRNSFATAVSDTMNNIQMTQTTTAQVTLRLVGPFNLNNVTFDANAHASMLGKNLVKVARKVGKEVVMDLVAGAKSTSDFSTKQAGMEDVIRELGEANAKLRKANATGVSKMFDSVFGGGNIFLMIIIGVIIFVLFFFRTAINTFFPGPLKYVLAIGLIYLIVAWWFRLFPFGSWPFGSSENMRKHTPMKIPSLGQSLARTYPTAEYSRRDKPDHLRNRIYRVPVNKSNVNARQRVYRQR